MTQINIYYSLSLLIFLPLSLQAIDIEPPANPNDVSSAMFTLRDICDRFDTGAAGIKRGANFVEPPIGSITGVGCTLDEAMHKAPIADNTDGAMPSEVVLGKTFWSLRTDGTWGPQTGTLQTSTSSSLMESITINSTTVNQPAGFYSAFNLSTVDLDLVAENIKNGVSLFGVVGTYSNPNASSSGNCAETVITEPRFIDNGDGTVTDHLTGLIWTKNANCSDIELGWEDAMNYANVMTDGICGLSDGSAANDWRVPNIKELQSLVDFSQINPSLPDGHLFSNVQTKVPYWSSTTFKRVSAWTLDLNDGRMGTYGKFGTFYVWAVRGGQ